MIKWLDILNYAEKGNPKPPRRVEKADAEWREILTEEEYHIARTKGTEKPFSGEFCEVFEPGLYECVCCGTKLFDSAEKFNSKSGWPSFTQPVEIEAVKYKKDKSFGMIRVEAMCNICDAHLGHVFPDGPAPSELRFCVNSASLRKSELQKG